MVAAWNFVWEKRGLLRFGHEERERGEGRIFLFSFYFMNLSCLVSEIVQESEEFLFFICFRRIELCGW